MSAVAHRSLRMFLLPHAGGSASIYRRWSTVLHVAFDGMVEPVAVDLPGHGTRAAEPLGSDLGDIVTGLTVRWPIAPGQRWALLGHSLGALIAAEWAAQAHRSGHGPELLTTSAAAPPWVYSAAADLYAPDDEDLWRRVAALGALSAAVARRPGLRRTHGPILRADLVAALAHRPVRPKPAGCPIIAMAGADDPLADASAVARWAEAATGGFQHHILAGGGHFYRTGVDDVLPLVTESLAALLRRTPVAA
jgi:surfactin synthase thioesterase subunit